MKVQLKAKKPIQPTERKGPDVNLATRGEKEPERTTEQEFL